MNTTNLTDEQLRYPIGRFQAPAPYTSEDIQQYIATIKTLPQCLRKAVIRLTDAQQNTTYRPDGWTLKQVVHHLADSHLNALTRIKLALTEDDPTIKPYNEAAWATQPDYRLPVESSLLMLEGIHQHIVALFESFTEAESQRSFYHPQAGKNMDLQHLLALYAWHSNHHLAHITETMKQWEL